MSIYLSDFHAFSWLSTFALVITGFVCGVIRWCHMCQPFNQNESYYYPARKWVTLIYMLELPQIIYLIMWDNPDAWIFAKSFPVLMFPIMCTIILRKYYFAERGYLSIASLIMGGVITATLLIAVILDKNILSENEQLTNSTVLLFAGFVGAILIYTTRWLHEKVKQYMRNEYASEDGFPLEFSRLVIPLPYILWSLSLIVFFCNNKTIYAIYCLMLCALNVIFLIKVLHPQRSLLDTEINESAKSNKSKVAKEEGDAELPKHIIDKLEERIIAIVEDEKMYLNPKINKNDLAIKIGTNRTYLSIVFRERFGSFYSYINRLRIEHSIEYIREHPGATQQEIAFNSGFGSSKTYAKTKALYKEGNL